MLYRACHVSGGQCTHLKQLLLQSLVQGESLVELTYSIRALLHAWQAARICTAELQAHLQMILDVRDDYLALAYSGT